MRDNQLPSDHMSLQNSAKVHLERINVRCVHEIGIFSLAERGAGLFQKLPKPYFMSISFHKF